MLTALKMRLSVTAPGMGSVTWKDISLAVQEKEPLLILVRAGALALFGVFGAGGGMTGLPLVARPGAEEELTAPA